MNEIRMINSRVSPWVGMPNSCPDWSGILLGAGRCHGHRIEDRHSDRKQASIQEYGQNKLLLESPVVRCELNLNTLITVMKEAAI